MIFYFSATGNSRYVAEKIAAATGDTAVSMIGQESSYMDDVLGIVSPTYAWGLPAIVAQFLQNFNINQQPQYLFFIATYGTTPGQTGRFVSDLLAPKGMILSAAFSVKMPDTWTPIFDLSDKEKVHCINARAELEIDTIIRQIKSRTTGNFMKNQVPYLMAKAMYAIEYDAMRKTKRFSVESSCIGCGLCARNCPVQAIELQGKHPVWVKEQCIMCLSCLHHCPKFAIQYGSHTKNHGQYTHPPFRPSDGDNKIE